MIMASLLEGTLPQKSSGMARVVNGSHSFTCTPTRLSTNGTIDSYHASTDSLFKFPSCAQLTILHPANDALRGVDIRGRLSAGESPDSAKAV